MKHKTRNLASRWISLSLTFFVFSSAVFAATLPEYKKKIHNARNSVGILLYSDVDDSNKTENLFSERRTLTEIRAGFSAAEKVEWKGDSIEVENGWILEKLAAFENESNSTKRKAILNEIYERLGAIETKVDELEKALEAGLSKDENKQKLAEILRRAEYQKPEAKKENILQKKWREFQEWLDSVFPKSKMGAPSTGSFQSFSYVLQLIIFAVVFGIIGFLIYRFAPFLRQRFKMREKKDKGARVILGETLAADETSQNLFAEAERLAREGNLRAAIRKGYIALLCELSDRKVIGLAQHKTNRDYLRDVRNRKELFQNMTNLTGSFERHWYGFDSTDEQDWEDFRQTYKQAVSK
jgi:hypothetical protein